MSISLRSRFHRGFTLNEVLVVIAIIAVIGGMTMATLNRAKKPAHLSVAKAELKEIAGALDNYYRKYHAYPPSNPDNPALNPLFYELCGVTKTNGNYQTLDNASAVPVTAYTLVFRVGGVINCAPPGGDVETAPAQNFLSGLSQHRIGEFTNGSGTKVKLLVTAVPSQESSYQPLGVPGLIPVCYTYLGTNNSTAYDLWVDLKMDGRTNRISNWSERARVL